MDTELQEVCRQVIQAEDALGLAHYSDKSATRKVLFQALLARQDSIRLSEAIQALNATIRGKRFN
jgi:hypothetical protein